MSKVLELDRQIRMIVSVFFRLMIIIYSILLITFSSDNYYEKYIYFLGASLYLTLYLLLRRKHSVIRLLNDYLFIVFIAYQKEFTPSIIIFCLLPIFNSPNHSGESRRPWLIYILTVVLFFLIVDFPIDSFRDFLRVAIPFLFPLAINTVELLRSEILRRNELINNEIDFYFEQDFEHGNVYRILRKVKALLNNSNWISFKTKNILLFKVKKNRGFLIATSKFVKSWRILSQKKFLESLNKSILITDTPITIDNAKYDKTIAVYYKGNEYGLLFFVCYDGLNFPFFYNEFLKSIFSRVARAIFFDQTLQEENRKYLEYIRNKTLFIDEVETSMHFMKNRLMPIYNFLPMIDSFLESESENNEETIKTFNREKNKIKIDVDEIIQKAENLNIKSKKTYLNYEVETSKIKKIIIIIRRIWSNYLDRERFLFNLNEDFEDEFYVRIFTDGLEILLSNIISNMSKHNNGTYRIRFYNLNNIFCVEFSNNYSLNNEDFVNNFINDFNSENKGEILRKTTRGAVEMKNQIQNLDLDYRLTNDSRLVKFTLLFNSSRNESSSF